MAFRIERAKDRTVALTALVNFVGTVSFIAATVGTADLGWQPWACTMLYYLFGFRMFAVLFTGKVLAWRGPTPLHRWKLARLRARARKHRRRADAHEAWCVDCQENPWTVSLDRIGASKAQTTADDYAISRDIVEVPTAKVVSSG